MNEAIEVFVHDIPPPAWIDNISSFIEKILRYLKFYKWNLCIVLCSNAFIRGLNKEFRSIDSATDVLSFAPNEGYAPNKASSTEGNKASSTEGNKASSTEGSAEEPYYAGDIVISVEALTENAEFFRVSENEELKRLIIHAILHLGGWDHSDLSCDQPMLRKQEEILSTFSQEILI